MALLATVANAALLWLLLAAATSLALSAAWLGLRRRSRVAHPASRARWIAALALAPCALPTLMLMLCFAPGLLALAGVLHDHCAAHPDHPHLCLAHPSALLTPGMAIVLAAIAAASLTGALRGSRRLLHLQRRCTALRVSRVRSLMRDVSEVDAAQPFSITAGLLAPQIFLSTALTSALSADHLAAVVAHEREHVRRRDPLLRMIAAAGSLPLWPRLRRDILAELRLASEQACDERAATAVGDRLQVAEALLAVERLASQPAVFELASCSAFGGSSVPARVRSLLADEPRATPARIGWWMVSVALCAMLAAEPLHHLAEHVLDSLRRSF
jgi:Zn-dependent protease with chaperone function